MWRVAIALLLLAALPVAAQNGSDWTPSEAVGLGPLILRAQSPLSVLRLAPLPLQPVTAPLGTWQAGALVNWNNYFAVDPRGRYVIDAESVGVTFGAAYGLSERIDVHLAVPISYRGGGILDAFVEDFEQSIGVPNEIRTAHPRDRYLVRIVDDDGTTFERTNTDAGWGVEDVTVGLRYQVTHGTATRPALLAFAGVKAPIGRETALRSTGGTDATIGLAVGQRLGRFHLYASAAAVRFSAIEIAGIELTRHQWLVFTGAEYRVSSRVSWLLQSTVTSPAARNFGDFAKRTYEVTLGFKRVISDDLLIEASVLENLIVFDNSPDVGFHVGLVWQSRPTAALGTGTSL